MSWYEKYNIVLNPPKRCSSTCSDNLTTILSEDGTNIIRAILYSQPKKLKILQDFLTTSRNKMFLYKILDDEIRRVLT
ncbi:S-S bond formation pathway protein [Monkeypox virus]|uniref:Protein OPG128 n=3 Tax=Monkeypox virus TaxID=10244 RepID=PG128_MONPV|nr:S-S bond formation pathway protein [Monkeypox virus]YP_010377110.1 S-S bond formation pathway protein [Monkeypox virus]M1L535.1 RecName: Full=Protein OPG128 [Monkeypox virus]AAL40571.1 A3L [Monkeypox virus Zaire-96-I-16]AAU01317.1 MPXV-WRAIR107 [Monkeypox virus]AAW67865.1 MPXV-SL-107 [Monkeypox virus]AAX09208.1 MPXV-COP-107 [Monkeypox virus]AAY96912.1 bifunctional unknown/involved in S-S bond formation pathway [Monkeypox virus]